MIVGHILVGVLSGGTVATLSLLLGASVWAALGCYVLAGSLGLMVSAFAGVVLARIRSVLPPKSLLPSPELPPETTPSSSSSVPVVVREVPKSSLPRR